MKRREFIALAGAAASWPVAAPAQPARKTARIGIVSIGGPTADMMGPLPTNRTVRAFLRAMAELGYVYGRDFVTEPRGTDSIEKVAELAELQVDVIVATGGGRVLSLLKQATTAIPVVMTAAYDLSVRQEFVQSLAHPGRNFTGMSLQTLELTGKRLELLKDLVPAAKIIAVFWDPTNPELWSVASSAGQARGWALQSIEIRDAKNIAEGFKIASDAGVDAALVPASGLLFSQASQIVKLAAQTHIPTIYELRPYVDVGGLFSYGADIEDIWRRAATFVDKILKGASPAELPIEQPTKFELIINKKTAEALGLVVPPSILIRADEVIE